MKTCDFCDNNDITQVEEANDLYVILYQYMEQNNIDSVSVVADEDITKWLLYIAINDECNFNTINLDHYNYNDAYIVTFENANDDIEIIVEKAKGNDDRYLIKDNTVFIQYDLPCKCQYIEDILSNNNIEEFKLKFFVVGEIKKHTFADHFENDSFSGDIFVESTSKEFVDIVRKIFGNYFNID